MLRSCIRFQTASRSMRRPSIRPVKTPLDLHLDEHLQEKKQRVLRKAAGAESAPIIDFDFSVFQKNSLEKDIDIDLFDNER